MTRYRIELPPFAQTYLQQPFTSDGKRRLAERVVVLFHRWLQRKGKVLWALDGNDIADFVSCPADEPVSQMTRNNYRYYIRSYLRWLEERGLAGPFEAHELEGYHRKQLPGDLRRFLQFLAPTHRASTVRAYRHVLRQFHDWLDERSTPTASVTREVCLAWAQRLHERGLHPATRVGQLVCVRKYLDWLWEQGTVAEPGYEMIRAADLPKKPEYLPRPLPPTADQQIQERLKEAESPVGLGLYVMRRTGLRVGELRRLERDCVREDHTGNRFLKVPLGKMNNERLVPLDETTLAAIAELQARAREGSRWLIEARARRWRRWLRRGRPRASGTCPCPGACRRCTCRCHRRTAP